MCEVPKTLASTVGTEVSCPGQANIFLRQNRVRKEPSQLLAARRYCEKLAGFLFYFNDDPAVLNYHCYKEQPLFFSVTCWFSSSPQLSQLHVGLWQTISCSDSHARRIRRHSAFRSWAGHNKYMRLRHPAGSLSFLFHASRCSHKATKTRLLFVSIEPSPSFHAPSGVL